MTSSNKRMGPKALLWGLEHLLAPLIIAGVVVWLNNLYQEKKQPNLSACAKEYHVTEISENKFKIECPFDVSNDGGSCTKSEKLTLSIRPTGQTISDICISEEYRGFYNVEDGGSGSNYVVLSVDLPKGKKIEGSIVFFSNTEIPEKSTCPLKINY